MLAFPPKDTLDVLDYVVQFASWLPTGAALSTAGGECTAVLDGVSTPGGLSDLGVNLVTVAGTDLVIWLIDGTDKETYTLLATVKDNQSPQRTTVRRIRVTMALK